MADEVDRATENAAFLLEARIKEQRNKAHNRPKSPLYKGGAEGGGCIDCGDAIPEKRRKAVPGCVRCIGCQTVVETH